MTKLIQRNILLACLSGLFAAIAVMYQLFLLGLVCLIPLFISIIYSKTASFKKGFFFGAFLSLPLFWWTVSGAEEFTGKSMLYGVAVYLCCVLLFSIFWSVILFLIALAQNKYNGKAAILIITLFTGCVWVLAEAILVVASTNLPWFGYRIGLSLSDQLYAIQPAAFLGAGVISFFVVIINYLAAYFIAGKQYRKLWVPVVIGAAYMLTGFFILQQFLQKVQIKQTIKVALVTQNIDPETKWNEATGNTLAQELIGLSKQAAALKPQMMVWTESIIPWTYRPDDDLMQAVIQSSGGITQIIGMNTDAAINTVYNSVYQINGDGQVVYRYDKQHALGFIEKPFAGILFPFLSSSGYAVQEGLSPTPLPTPFGKAGILICNESAIPKHAKSITGEGADFLLNLSNDGWFADSYLADVHFYNARLRAVENRRDVVVNSNKGYCGIIQASGKMATKYKSHAPHIEMVTLSVYSQASP